MRQKASFEQSLKGRQSYLSGKGIKSLEAEKDTIVKKLQADIRAVNKRLRAIADNDKRTEETARIKVERAALPKEQEISKSEKPKKAQEDGKGKKVKPETIKKKAEEKREEPAGQVKTGD
jgi:DNA polymerase III delta prime subunit